MRVASSWRSRPGPSGDQNEEDFIYHGWVFAYDASNLTRPPQIYCSSGHGRGGGIWQAGSGLAGDDQGVYFTTSNGILDNATHPPAAFPASPVDQENSVVRLPAGGGRSPALAKPSLTTGTIAPIRWVPGSTQVRWR
jgi:hypothetical protein